MRYTLLLTLLACGELPGLPNTKIESETKTEGMNPGECTDGADNDQDGVYDCDDSCDCLVSYHHQEVEEEVALIDSASELGLLKQV